MQILGNVETDIPVESKKHGEELSNKVFLSFWPLQTHSDNLLLWYQHAKDWLAWFCRGTTLQ